MSEHSDIAFAGDHITIFSLPPGSPRTVTKLWSVVAEGGSVLGMIKWYAPWRKYAFFPFTDTLYEEVCMREIANFIEHRTHDHRRDHSERMHAHY